MIGNHKVIGNFDTKNILLPVIHKDKMMETCRAKYVL